MLERLPNSNISLPADIGGLAGAFEQLREGLKRSVDLRMDPRLRGRVDLSDVVQDTFIDATRRFEEFQRQIEIPLPLWLPRANWWGHCVTWHRSDFGALVAPTAMSTVEQNPARCPLAPENDHFP